MLVDFLHADDGEHGSTPEAVHIGRSAAAGKRERRGEDEAWVTVSKRLSVGLLA